MTNYRVDANHIDKVDRIVESALKELGVNVTSDLQDCIDKAGKDAVKKLKANSPKRGSKYSRGWKYKKLASKDGNHESLVYNSSGWLTHLLEHGHPIIRNGVVVGNAKAKPHIEPVDEWLQTEFPKLVSDKLKAIK